MIIIFEFKSKQYKLDSNSSTVLIENESKELKDNLPLDINIDKILLYDDGSSTIVGRPYISNMSIVIRMEQYIRGKKEISLKRKKKKNYKRTVGFRKDYFLAKLGKITLGSSVISNF